VGQGFADAPGAPLTWRQNADYSGLNVLGMGIFYEALQRSVCLHACLQLLCFSVRLVAAAGAEAVLWRRVRSAPQILPASLPASLPACPHTTPSAGGWATRGG
jgi:hypothetical protein